MKVPSQPVRRLTPVDAVPYRALMLAAYERAPEAFTSTVAEREHLPLSWWAARTSGVPGTADCVVGAFVAGRLVGAAGLAGERQARTRHKGRLFGMFVQEDERGRGLGDLLVRQILHEAGVMSFEVAGTPASSDAQRLRQLISDITLMPSRSQDTCCVRSLRDWARTSARHCSELRRFRVRPDALSP